MALNHKTAILVLRGNVLKTASQQRLRFAKSILRVRQRTLKTAATHKNPQSLQDFREKTASRQRTKIPRMLAMLRAWARVGASRSECSVTAGRNGKLQDLATLGRLVFWHPAPTPPTSSQLLEVRPALGWCWVGRLRRQQRTNFATRSKPYLQRLQRHHIQ
jgi:hypothetical protein